MLFDRDGAWQVLERVQDCLSWLRIIWADAIYAGQMVDWVKQKLQVRLEIFRRSDDVAGFEVCCTAR